MSREVSAEDLATARAFLSGRQWLRCDSCGHVGDSSDEDGRGFVVDVDAGKVLSVVCMECDE